MVLQVLVLQGGGGPRGTGGGGGAGGGRLEDAVGEVTVTTSCSV